jgi:copper homeostasis protein
MKEDLQIVKKMEFEGIVFGMLNEHSHPDILRIKEMVSLANPMKVTFHRAFDVCSDPIPAIDLLASCGIDSLLTSGQQNTAIEGVQLITILQNKAGKHIKIIAGSGINDENIIQLAQKTGLKYFHMSAKIMKSPGINNPVQISSLHEAAYRQYLTDENLVRKIKSMPL